MKTQIRRKSHGAAFTYAHDGFLAKQVVDGVETRFVRGVGFLCLEERNASNAATRMYVWDSVSPGGIGGLLKLRQKDEQQVMRDYHYLYDGKGNVRAVVKASDQSVVASYSYDEFGNLVSETSTVEQPFKFSTKRYYDGIGLNYYGYRFYSPSLGRWMTRDPIGEEGGLNLYSAMGNNAVNWVDVWGLKWIFIGWREVTTEWVFFRWSGWYDKMLYAVCEDTCNGEQKDVYAGYESLWDWSATHPTTAAPTRIDAIADLGEASMRASEHGVSKIESIKSKGGQGFCDKLEHKGEYCDLLF